MNNRFGERRKNHRFKVPIQIDAPVLSDSPLVAEDVSKSGCRVVVSKKPQMGEIFECTLRVRDKVYDHCQGEVVWYMNKGKSSTQWSCGLILKMEGRKKGKFIAELEKLTEQPGTMSHDALIR